MTSVPDPVDGPRRAEPGTRDVSVREMRAVLAVARHANVSQAAEELRTAQSNLSRIIANVETRVGHLLFVRGSRGLVLTAEGRVFREAAQRVVDLHEFEMERLAGRLQGVIGRVRIASIPSASSLVVPKLLRLMRTRFPDAEISFVDANSAQVHDLVRERRADIGIASDPPKTTALHHRKYLVDAFVALVSAQHPFAARAEVSWEDVAADTVVRLPGGTSVRTLTTAAFAHAGVSPREEMTAPNIGLAAGLVAEGLGIAAVPALTLGLFDYPGLVRIPLIAPTVSRQLHLLHRGDEEDGPAIEVTIAALRSFAEQRLPLPYGVSWSDE